MNSARVQTLLMLIAAGFCLASAETVVTDKPNTFVEHSNGLDASIPGTTLTRLPTKPQAKDQSLAQPQPDPELQPAPQSQSHPQDVSSFVYNHNGNVALNNGAGSIFTRPDGRTVLLGAGGQTIVTDGDDSDEDDSSGFDSHRGHVYAHNGNSQNSFVSSSRGSVLVNGGGEGSYQTFNNYQLRLVNGGLQLTVDGKVYNFPPKAADANSKETIEINGQQATVQYENGNIIVELADGTVMAKADNGLFSGDRQSFVNRKQIQEDAVRQAAQLQQQIQDQIASQMQQLQEHLQFNLGHLGNIRF